MRAGEQAAIGAAPSSLTRAGFAPGPTPCYERRMRTAALVLALAGAAATGLSGLFMIGSALAETERVEQARQLRPHLVTAEVVGRATSKRDAAIALLAACVAALAAAPFLKRSRIAGLPLLAAAIAPLPFALWAVLPVGPLLAAGALALYAAPQAEGSAGGSVTE